MNEAAALGILLNGLWQAGVLLVAGLLAARVLARAPAARRGALWSAVLACACLAPIATAIDVLPAVSFARETAVLPLEPSSESIAGGVSAATPASSAGEETMFTVPVIRSAPGLARWIVTVYLAIVALLFVKLCVDLLRMKRMKRRARAMPAVMERVLARCSRAYDVRRRVDYGLSRDVATPVFLGLLHPMLLVPETLESMPDHDLEVVGAHELAHAQRRDDWRILVERCIRIIWFFNPSILWMCRRISLEREMTCDEWAITRTRATPSHYADTLLRLAEHTLRRSGMQASQLTSQLNGSSLRHRIEWLLCDVFVERTKPAPQRIALAGAVLVISAIAVFAAPTLGFTTAAAIVAGGAGFDVAGTDASRVSANDAVDALEQAGYSGAVLVAVGDRIVVQRGFGVHDRASRAPATSDTHFNSGAIAKMLTAAAILKLEDEGRLSVRDPITRWLGELPAPKDRATIHDLLVHMGGLTSPGSVVQADTRDGFIARIRETPAEFAPGTQLRHTDVGYSTLALIVEIVSGVPYEQYVRTQLLEPAGMTETWFQSERARGVVAREYERQYAGLRDASSEVGARGYAWGRRGAMGIYSTVGDLYKWQRALESDLFERDDVRRMHSVGLRNPWGSRTGYGWETYASSRGTKVQHVLSNWRGNSVELMRDDAADVTVALIIDAPLDWARPRHNALARAALGNARAFDMQQLVKRVQEPY